MFVPLFILCIFLCVPSSLAAAVCDPLNCPIAVDTLPTLKSNASHTLAIGYISATTVDPSNLAMARWKINQINNNASIMIDTRVDLYPTKQGVVGAVATMIQRYSVRALIVDLPEAGTQLVADVATAYGVSVLSISSTTNVLDSKAEFSNLFARLSVTVNNECVALLTICRRLNITAITYVFSQNLYGLNAAADCVKLGTSMNISVLVVPTNGQDSVSIVQNFIVDSKVIFLATDIAEGLPLVHAIQSFGAYGPEYFYIFSLGMGLSVIPFPNNPMTDGAMMMFGTIYSLDHPYYILNNNLWYNSNATLFPGMRPAIYGWPTMDAANMYADSFNSLLVEGIPFKNITGVMLHNRLTTTTQESASGTFNFDANGDRPGSFVIFNIVIAEGLNETNAVQGVAAYYDVASQYTTILKPDYVYANGSTTNPFFVLRFNEKCSFKICSYRGNCSSAATCICDPGFTGQHCEKRGRDKLSGALLAEIIAPVVVVLSVIMIVAFFFVQRRRREIAKEVKDKQRSDIPRGEIKLSDRIGRGAAGEVMKGMFRGTEVAVKRLLTTNASKNTIDEFSLEVAIMCGLRHPNIIMFMGSCYDPASNEMLLVMELMSRGSLHDVLHNSKVQLPFDMQLHLALQAAQGMNFLHSSNPPIIHCDLKSHNILLDDKWTARISDFGITRFKEAAKGKKETDNASFGTIFWTAPEVLDGRGHSEQSDCYAYGVVLWELFHRQTPYNGMDVMQVAVEVGKGRRPEISSSCPADMKRLIQQCWHQDPRQRPSMQQIVDDLRQEALMNPLQDLGNHSLGRVQAPVGQVYLVKTLLCHGLTLCDMAPRAAAKSFLMYNQHLRTTIESYGGYEVHCVVPNFLVSFQDLKSALDWCISVQISLLHLAWPPEIYDLPEAAKQRASSGELLWSGPRVRMVIHSGAAITDKDAVGRIIYNGPVIERVRKILGESSEPGIQLSSVVYEELNEKRIQLAEPIVTPCERTQKENSTTYFALPQKLAKRRAPGMDAPVLNLNSPEDSVQVISIEEGASLIQSTVPSWFIKWNDLTVTESIGRGAIGDYHKAIHKGKEVAVKLLVNQKLREEDKIQLWADVALLSKINHPNLLSVIGGCQEEHRNLREMLSDSNVSISMVQSLKIARDIAQGMGYLTSLPDLEVRIHDNFKSHNVMIGKNWEVKVTDYGQSNIKDLARTMTSVSNVAWTAPEVLEGEEITPESALYSYGMILWEILTRKVPYEKEHPIKVVTKILAGYRPAIPNEKIPPQCITILEGCWNRQIDMRPSWHVIQSELSVAIDNLQNIH